ncbi:MAG: DUF559 domain-containing protein [Nitrososphaerota archaeon]|jgi:very-short-patch-repair endonuclease|nr:DUF559 domain-containing protein [Nitrososphaerota archaeon]
MNYKQNMHPKVSKGEISVFTALSKANLTYGMVTQKPIILKFTLPDFSWPNLKKAVYLDGIQVHQKAHIEQRDQEINNLLEQRGWQTLRIPYTPPLTEKEIMEIVNQIHEFIDKNP